MINENYLERLPPKLREVYQWRHGINGTKLTYRAIAQRWNCDEKWVKKSYEKACRYLERLEKEDAAQAALIKREAWVARLLRCELLLYLHVWEIMFPSCNHFLSFSERFAAKSINGLNLSTRTRNVLVGKGFNTIRDILATDEFGMYALPNLGEKSLQELQEEIDRQLDAALVGLFRDRALQLIQI